jgi:predicted nucleic acid-binding Zn ribbon protein
VTTPTTTAPPTAATGPTHPCVRCGAPVPMDVGLCERCNPLGLRDSSSSQVHGMAFLGVGLAVILLAVFAHLAVAGVGPFDATATAAADVNGLAVTLTVTNHGSNPGQTTCRVTDPADRTGAIGAIVLSPRIEAARTVTFTTHTPDLGTAVVPLKAECTSP